MSTHTELFDCVNHTKDCPLFEILGGMGKYVISYFYY